MRADLLQARHPIHSISGKMKAVELVQHGHIERRGDRSLFLVAMNVKISVVFSAIGKPVNQRWIPVVGKNYWPVGCEHGIEIAVGNPVRMLDRRLQRHQIDHVTTRILMSAKCCRSRSTAASVSRVGTSPAQAITT